MKFIAKINRGAILTAVVLILVAAYLIGLSISQNMAKAEIRQVCGEYVQTEIRYSMIPEQYRSEQPDMPAADQELYLADMAKDLKAFYIDNEAISKISIDKIRSRLMGQMNGIDVVYDYQKTIAKYNSFEFDQGMVTVTLVSNTVFDGTLYNNMIPGRQKEIGETTDTIILQKVDGIWKVVVANLVQPGNSSLPGGYQESFSK